MKNNETKKDQEINDEINIFVYYKIAKKYFKMMIGIVAVVSILAVIVSLNLTELYLSDALIVPVGTSNTGGLAALASQFGGLASFAGINPGSSDYKFVAILKSRTLIENVITSENLKPIFFKDLWDPVTNTWVKKDQQTEPSMEQTVDVMRGITEINQSLEDQTIRVAVKYSDPKIASQIVNAYLRELQKFIDSQTLTSAKRHRIFTEGQVEKNKKELLEIGEIINNYYNNSNNNKSFSKTTMSVENEILNPNYQNNDNLTLEELMIKKMENEDKIKQTKMMKDVSPRVYYEYLVAQYSLLLQVQMTLSSQLQMAKIQESKDDLAFSVIDNAVPPEMRVFPARGQICILSFVIAFFFSVVLAFFREYLARMRALENENK